MSEGVTEEWVETQQPGDGRPAWAVLCAHFFGLSTDSDGWHEESRNGSGEQQRATSKPPPETRLLRLGSQFEASRMGIPSMMTLALASILPGNGDTQIGTQGSHSDSGWQLRTQHTFSRTSGLREQDQGPRGAQPARTPLHGARPGTLGQHQKGQDGVRQARLHPFAHK